MSDSSAAPTPAQMVHQLLRLVQSELSPQDFLVYKPRGGKGAALKLNLRVHPEFKPTKAGTEYVVKDKKQGLFIEMAAEGPKGASGFPEFQWHDPAKVVRAKLGIPDITRLLLSIREYRSFMRDVPKPFRPGPDVDKHPNVFQAFHKFGEASSIVTYTFRDETMSILEVSRQYGKGKEPSKLSISLNLEEELAFERYLQLSLDAFLRCGMR
jgi:hypothetical protein